ncbi:MAG: hypothetical protein K6F86_13180 [Lachnospiraceae bacterium]|nr:hypothetical protein [Lachnospiraceae bacterium]
MYKKIVSLALASLVTVSMLFAGVDIDTAFAAERTSKKEKETEKKAEEFGLEDEVYKDLPTEWDLTDLYADEEAFEDDMKLVEELLPKVEEIKGTLNSVEGILNDLENPDHLKIDAILKKADMYTSFLRSIDASDSWAKKASARYNEVFQKVILAYSFEDSEIMQMPLKKRKEIFSDESLKPYAYSLRNYTDPDFVVLSEEAGRVKALLTGAQNSEDVHDIFDHIDVPKPTLTYPDGKEEPFSDAAYARIIQSNEYDHEFRKEASAVRNAMRQPYANTYAALLEGKMRSNWADAQIKGFDSSLEASLKDSDVEPEIYEKIIDFSHDMLPKIYEYYEARKEILDLDEMCLCDLNIPVTDYDTKEMSYDDAMNKGRKAVSVWGDEYLSIYDMIAKSSHIDVYPSPIKDTGAFESLEGNETTPFIMFNFDGTENYISTLVHEMGHAVYSEFAAENQNEYNNEPGIFTQEVASTSNEIMFNKYMIENAKTKDEKLYWLDKEITLFMGTIIRQCLYSEFEDYCYKTIEEGGSLNADDMAEKWLELNRLYYGDAVSIEDDYGIDWARIPHLYYNYYVYKYATSLTYAASVCQQVEDNGQKEIDAYIDFLKAGASDSPSSLLQIAGVDPLDDDTYKAAGELIGSLIDEFIETSGADKRSSGNSIKIDDRRKDVLTF